MLLLILILFLPQVSNDLSCLEDVKPLVELLENLMSTFLTLFSKSSQNNEKELDALEDLNSELMKVPALYLVLAYFCSRWCPSLGGKMPKPRL